MPLPTREDLLVRVATRYHPLVDGVEDWTTEPDVRVDPTVEDGLAEHERVLAEALARRADDASR